MVFFFFPLLIEANTSPFPRLPPSPFRINPPQELAFFLSLGAVFCLSLEYRHDREKIRSILIYPPPLARFL